MDSSKFLITGCAGFIGFHLAKMLIKKGYFVVGIDNLNNYYDVNLKKGRLKYLKKNSKKKFIFKKIDLSDEKKLKKLFKYYKFKTVINLAAQAGVRHSLVKPKSYIKSNLIGFFNILQVCKNHKIPHLIYASTSSVYGNSKKFPIKESAETSKPLQLYAATKKSNELMAECYSNLYNMRITGLRFFTVYGPWGRPDMALSIFTRSIIKKKPVSVFNYGNHERDFTYVEDIANGITKLINSKNFSKANAGKHRVYNLGNNKPISLKKYITLIENNLKIKAKKIYKPLQPGDVKKTHSSSNLAKKDFGFLPTTDPETGIKKFINWYKNYYGTKKNKI